MSRPHAKPLAHRMAATGSVTRPKLRAIAGLKHARNLDTVVAAFLNTYAGVLLVALFLGLYAWVSTDEFNTRQLEQTTYSIR